MLLLFLGVLSFYRNGSLIAIIVGVVGGLSILISLIYGSMKDVNTGFLFIAAISLILATYFGITFASDNTFLPSGFMLLLSAVSFATVGFSWLDNRQQ